MTPFSSFAASASIQAWAEAFAPATSSVEEVAAPAAPASAAAAAVVASGPTGSPACWEADWSGAVATAGAPLPVAVEVLVAAGAAVAVVGLGAGARLAAAEAASHASPSQARRPGARCGPAAGRSTSQNRCPPPQRGPVDPA